MILSVTVSCALTEEFFDRRSAIEFAYHCPIGLIDLLINPANGLAAQHAGPLKFLDKGA
jgi:hypothetical protein